MLVFDDGRNIPADTLDSYIVSLELAYRELIVLDTTTQLNSSQRSAVNTLRSSLVELCDLQETACHQLYFQASSRPISCGIVGRPRFDVPSHKLAFLIENRFTVPQIAELLGISVRTVHRRMTDAGLSIRACYANISDRELDELVHEIRAQFPMCGNRQMTGHLQSRGFRVQQFRVREAQRRVDPAGTLVRRLRGIHRRQYSVAAPRSLYHMDGNHKLIRYAEPTHTHTHVHTHTHLHMYTHTHTMRDGGLCCTDVSTGTVGA